MELLDLPVEILEWIATYIPSFDLLRLRSACRLLDAISQKSVASTFFSDVCVILSCPISMWNLLQIATHERFSRSMRHIRLSHMRLRSSFDDHDTRRLEYLTIPNREERARIRQMRGNHTLLSKSESEFREGQDTTILAAALLSFKAAGNTPAISSLGRWLEDDIGPAVKALGLEKMRSALGYRNVMYRPWADAHLYEVLFEALAQTEYPIETLELGDPSGLGSAFSVTSFSPPLLLLSGFSALRSLQLVLRPHGPPPWNSTSRATWMDDMSRFLLFVEAASNVERFSLTIEDQAAVRGSTHWATFGLVAQMRPNDGLMRTGKVFPKLQCLELEHHSVDLEMLLKFVRDRRATLKGIRLQYIRDGSKDYPDINDQIRNAAGAWEHEDFWLSIIDCYNGGTWLEDLIGW